MSNRTGEAATFGLAMGLSHACSSLTSDIQGSKIFAACVLALISGFVYRLGGAGADFVKEKIKGKKS